MSSRAKKKREFKEHVIIENLKQNQKELELSRAQMEAAEKDFRKIHSGDFSSFSARRQEAFQRNKAITDEVMRKIARNGITVEDVDNAWASGREEGFRQAGETIVKCCYAGIILALHDEFGFDEDQCFKAIKAVDERTIYALNHSEMVEEVLEKTGLQLELDDPLERVQRR